MKDRNGRTLGTVFSKERGYVNAELVRMGMAWHNRRYSNSTGMQGFEDYAKENKKLKGTDALEKLNEASFE